MVAVQDTSRISSVPADRPAKQAPLLTLVTLASIAWFCLSLVALHLLRPDVPPLARGISHYANGPYGFLLTVASVVLGVGGITLVLGLYRSVAPSAGSRVGLVLLGVWGVATALAGIFPIDAPGAPPTIAGAIHSLAGLNFLCAVGATLLLARRFRQDDRWAAFARPAVVVARAVLVAAIALYILIEPLSTLGLGGLAQRVYWATLLVWLAVTALRLRAIAATQRSAAAPRALLSRRSA